MLEVVVYSLIGGVLSLIGGFILINNKKTADGLAKYATPFAAGVLLAAAFGDLLPEALGQKEFADRSVLLAALFGILGFFLLERFLRWFHHHHEEDGTHKTPSSLIIIGDTLHNALDGIAIGAAFLIDTPTGIVAAVAVAAHEIPQEIGDFGLLLRNGMKKADVIKVNIISALATVVTAVLTFQIGDSEDFPTALLLAITAGFFTYIAASDIIPEIHSKIKGKKQDVRPWLLIVGAALILIVSPIAHDLIDSHDHDDEHSQSHSDSHSHGSETHKDYILPPTAPIPEVTIMATQDDSGLNLMTSVTNFTFTPEEEGGEPAVAEGHAHLYIDGKKITRIYGEWTFVPKALLPESFDSVTVTLSNNDHSEYHLVNGDTISGSASVTKSESHDSDGDTDHNQEAHHSDEMHNDEDMDHSGHSAGE